MYEPYGTSGRSTVTLERIRRNRNSPLEEAVGDTAECSEFDVVYKLFEILTFRIEEYSAVKNVRAETAVDVKHNFHVNLDYPAAAYLIIICRT